MGGGVYTVLSGSMEPAYHVGSLIYVKPVDHKELKQGDAITFAFTESIVVTHRIVGIDSDYQWFETKGDANEVKDGSPVYYKNIIGKPVFSVPYIGFVISYLQTGIGKITAAVVVVILFIFGLLPQHKKEGKRAREGN